MYNNYNNNCTLQNDLRKQQSTHKRINLVNEQNNIDKIYLYARDLCEPKYEY